MVLLDLQKQFLRNPIEVGEIELVVLFLARALVKYRKGLGKHLFTLS